MPDDLATTIGAVVQRLVSLAMGDAELQAGLRQLAEQFLKQTAPPTTVVGETVAEQRPGGRGGFAAGSSGPETPAAANTRAAAHGPWR